jgi:hypothetical protein
MTFSTRRPVAFPLYLRVPGWCEKPVLSINGADVPVPGGAGRYVLVERTWSSGDRLALRLPMRVTLTRWARNKNSASVSRGPLTYSLKIGEKVVRLRPDDKWPAFEFYPTTPWNYGLVLEGADAASTIEVVARPSPVAAQPFTVDDAPIELRVKAKKIPGWTLDRHGLTAVLRESPIASSEPVETVSLIPMGCARLRIASFPVIGEGPNAQPWPVSPEPASRHKASHCFESDTVDALSNGSNPTSSNDRAIPRFTWWPRLGTEEWVTCEFSKPAKVSHAEVYWFDDTGAGQCRTPKSWRLEYLDGRTWKPVDAAGAFGIARDQFNALDFRPVTTKGLRIVAQLQSDFSSGILQWRVK